MQRKNRDAGLCWLSCTYILVDTDLVVWSNPASFPVFLFIAVLSKSFSSIFTVFFPLCSIGGRGTTFMDLIWRVVLRSSFVSLASSLFWNGKQEDSHKELLILKLSENPCLASFLRLISWPVNSRKENTKLNQINSLEHNLYRGVVSIHIYSLVTYLFTNLTTDGEKIAHKNSY